MAAAAAAEAARALGSADPACATGGQHQLLGDGATGDSSAVGASRMLDAARSSAASGAAGGDGQRSADLKFREYASSPGKRKRDEVEAAEARDEAQAMGAAGGGDAAGGGCAFSAACPPHVTQAQPRVASCSDSSKSSDERSQPSRSCSQEAAQPGAPLGGPAAGLNAAAAAAAATLAGDSSGPAVLGGLPLRGCISEYVQRWGWSPLPHGTQQLLRDILQTLCATRRSAPPTTPCLHDLHRCAKSTVCPLRATRACAGAAWDCNSLFRSNIA